MASISSEYPAAAYAPAQVVAAAKQGGLTGAPAVAPVAAAPQSDSYSSQAYQMTLGNASAAQQNMQTVQSQNHLIEQMNAGFGGDEV